jgi:hypothetical protein
MSFNVSVADRKRTENRQATERDADERSHRLITVRVRPLAGTAGLPPGVGGTRPIGPRPPVVRHVR